MSDAPVLRCEGVVKTFGGVRAVDGVDFELHAGEIRGLVGPNGSGKSTLINVLSGFMRADAGVITIDGTRINGLDAHKVAELGVARTYQIPRPFGTLSVLENVEVACHFGAAGTRSSRDVADQSRRWVGFVGLEGVADARIGSLTLMQRKLLELARALACRPRVLFLDEVLTGLTPTELQHGIDLIRRINEQGIAIVAVEHIMRVIRDLCEHTTVLNFGKVIATGDTASCLDDPQVVEAYLGRADA